VVRFTRLEVTVCWRLYDFQHCRKKYTDVAYYNFNVHQKILVIFDRDVA